VIRNGKARFVAEIMVGTRPDGSRDRRYVSANTEKECLRALEEVKAQMRAGTVTDAKAGRETVAAFLTTWLDSLDGTIEPQSARRHRDNVNRHIVPLIGYRKLADLRPEHVVQMLAALRAKKLPATAKNAKKAPQIPPKAKERRLSPRTVKYCYTTLRLALDVAVRYGAVPRNVARVVTAPKIPRAEVVAPLPEEVSRLLAAAEAASDRLAPLWTVAVLSGCRPGELLGLTWRDVDLDAGTIAVRRTLVGTKAGSPIMSDPKTTRATRTFVLPAEAVAALKAQEGRQRGERDALGDRYRDHNLVFTTAIGTPLNASNVSHYFKRALKRAGLPETYTPHKLRHATATMMLAAGVSPKVAADRLGHHSPAFTLDRYTHAVKALDEDAAISLQSVLDRAREKAAAG
jgi:integrase